MVYTIEVKTIWFLYYRPGGVILECSENTQNGSITIKHIHDFEPEHIFECGQSFRWYVQDDGSYTGIAMGKVINVKKDGSNLIINNSSVEDFHNIWYKYFDLDTDYGAIKERLSADPILDNAIRFGEGIRILKQDEWETLVSFIISANNAIPRIKKSIKRISEKWGKPVEYSGNIYYTFPGPDVLSSVDPGEIQECGVGFRAAYISKTARAVYDGDISLYDLKDAGYERAREMLMSLPGVGPKVSDCVLLFSMGYSEAFPVDVWVKRIMQYFYLAPDVSLPKIEKYAQQKYGSLAGYAQQYLFYYARNSKVMETSK